MAPDPFNNLTAQEIQELSYCGISSSLQLFRTTPDAILKDLEKAREFFPEKTFTLDKPALERIFAQLSGDTERPVIEDTPDDLANFKKISLLRTPVGAKKELPPLLEKRIKKRNQEKILHSPVHAIRPLIYFLATFSYLLLIIPLATAIILPFMSLTKVQLDLPLPLSQMVVICIILPILPYLVTSRRATCPVCHMRVFSFKRYNRNRAAHHIPLLGYNAALALNILFRWQYHCPACGTPVKIRFGRKSRKRH